MLPEESDVEGIWNPAENQHPQQQSIHTDAGVTGL
jgi:hypothetical protein